MTNNHPFNRRLITAQETQDSLLCVGLDPDLRKLPDHLSRDADGVYTFCSEIIAQTSEFVCAYKINSAFFEVLGARGFEILEKLRGEIPDDILAIYDVKRGDIGNTAKQYAYAAFDTLNMDAVTVNPYMGADAVEPFIRDPTRGAFVLCLTSNPGSADFERLQFNSGDTLYESVAKKCVEWNAKDNVGLVVGATQAESLGAIRKIAGTLPILAPGVGAQGGDLRTVLEAGLTDDENGLVIPISRAILYAGSGKDFAEDAGEAAYHYSTLINRTFSNE
ncbi:MAG: orotidine-5'-phosphate decarboxylase [Candidatus Marinimicrobia bacterium]|nr:orotidine-5'-phosphate decarboxylase [Candidatus Neomarinimicrobiota bacterium]MCF7830006.1 orotidine-5'-phosphate decarboxylase [Candidatus Neomarinimicrobiota bacterium]MCF7881952.1 orotidine-5'-phosphate decarboxylase [Candidatus Neomarinimicrobiota bacterium]